MPLLVEQQIRMKVPQFLDEHFPQHGGRKGLSFGWLSALWLSYILSESNHRLSHARSWAESCLHSLKVCSGQEVRPEDFTDDRLGDILYYLSNDDNWLAFEQSLNGNTIRTYKLESAPIRLDSTSANGHWEVFEKGLFQFGYSKDHRPDLPQIKVKMSTLDPLGMPLVTTVLPGQRADDPEYIPAIEKVRQNFEQRGLLFVGDSKMDSLKTRAFIQKGKDYYLTPLSKKQLSHELLEDYTAPALEGTQKLETIYRTKADGKTEEIALAYEISEKLELESPKKPMVWRERRIVVQSLGFQKQGEKTLKERLRKATAEFNELNQRGKGRKRYPSKEELSQAVDKIAKKHRVQGLFEFNYKKKKHQRKVREYGGKPSRIETTSDFTVLAKVDQNAVVKSIERMGWRVFATNAPKKLLSISQVVLTYRDSFMIERGFGRLKGKPLSLTPMYLQKEEHVVGLVRLLSIGLRILTLMEFVVRRRLKEKDRELVGLYAPNPKRATMRPTTEAILKAFKNISLTILKEKGSVRYHFNPLSILQQEILLLLDFPTNLYQRFVTMPP